MYTREIDACAADAGGGDGERASGGSGSHHGRRGGGWRARMRVSLRSRRGGWVRAHMRGGEGDCVRCGCGCGDVGRRRGRSLRICVAWLCVVFDSSTEGRMCRIRSDGGSCFGRVEGRGAVITSSCGGLLILMGGVCAVCGHGGGDGGPLGGGSDGGVRSSGLGVGTGGGDGGCVCDGGHVCVREGVCRWWQAGCRGSSSR